MLQLVLPNAQQNIDDQAYGIYKDHATQGAGSAVIIHGINDEPGFWSSWMNNVNAVQPAYVQAAWKNALRSVISRLRSNLVFASSMSPATGTTIIWDPTITFGGSGGSHWTDVASTTQNTGPAYKKSTTNNDTVTFTIPGETIPGTTFAFCILAQANTLAYITNQALGSTNATDVIAFVWSLYPPIVGSVILMGTEQMQVAASGGTWDYTTNGAIRAVTDGVTNGSTTVTSATAAFVANDVGKAIYGSADIPNGATITAVNSATSVTISTAATGSHSGQTLNISMCITVTRGFNSTTKTTHALNDSFQIAPNMQVAWSGTASAATGTTVIGGQGQNNSTVALVKRFTVTASDVAGSKTIIATFSGIPAGDTYSYFAFDSVWSETPYPSPVVITNIQHYSFAQAIGSQTVHLIAGFNTATQSVVSEFDSFVQIADVYAPFYQNNGTITSSMNNTDTSTVIGWTCNSSNYTPYVGAVMSFGTQYGEHVLVTAVSGSAPNWTLTLTRGYDTTGKQAWANGSWLCPIEWMNRSDEIHPSAEGHAVFANAIYNAFKAMPAPTAPHQYALSSGNWALNNQSFMLGPIDNTWSHTSVSTLTTNTPTLNTEYFLPIYVPRLSVLTGLGFAMKTGTTVTCRFGIYQVSFNHEGPGTLIQDFGSQTLTGTAPYAAQQTGIYQVQRPGWYWLGVVWTAGVGTAITIGNLGLNWPVLSSSAISTSSTASFITGYSQTGVSGALGTSASATATNSTSIPVMWYRLRTNSWG